MTWFAIEQPRGKLLAQLLALVASRGILLAATVIVTRVTGITDYGAFALALVVFQAGLLLRDAGIGQALIILGAETEGLLWHAFVVVTSVGVSLSLVMAAFAGPLAELLGVPSSAPQLMILSLAFGLGSVGVVSNAQLERQLRFKARALIDIAAYSGLGIVTVGGLLLGMGVDALAWGYVLHGLVQAGIALLMAPPWQSRAPRRPSLSRLLRYGGLLWAAAVLAYLASNLDNALIARLGGAMAIGGYALSYTIGNTVTIGLAQVLNRVALPYYGRATHTAPAVQRALNSILPLSVAVGLVPASIIIALAPEIRAFLLGPSQSLVPIVALAVYGAVRSYGMSLGTALNGTGRARRTTIGSAINVVFMASSIVPAFLVAGTVGASLAVLAAMLVSTTFLTLSIAPFRISYSQLLLPGLGLAALAVMVGGPSEPPSLMLRISAGTILFAGAVIWGVAIVSGRRLSFDPRAPLSRTGPTPKGPRLEDGPSP